MSEQPRALGWAQSLRRRLAIRIGSALAVLIALVSVALHQGPSAPAPPTGAGPAAAHGPAEPDAAPALPPPAEQPARDTASAVVGSGQDSGPRAATQGTEAGVAAVIEPQSAVPANAQNDAQRPAGTSAAGDTSTGDTGLPTASAMTQGSDKPHMPGRPPGAGKPPRGTYLQAGVFMQPANAQAFKESLAAQGLPVFVESRVHVGPFKDRKEAERVREQLRESGVATVVVSQSQ